MQDVGQQLARFRRKRKLTRCELATLADMDVNHLRGIENGVHKYPRNETIDKLAKALRVQVFVVVQEADGR